LLHAGRWHTPDLFATELMAPEWLVEVPEALGHQWLVFPRAQGKRCLLVASRGRTVARARNGSRLDRFRSSLPGGGFAQGHSNGSYTILDCVLQTVGEGAARERRYYVQDCLCWNGHPMYECEAEMRIYWLQSQLAECETAAVTELNHRLLLPTPCFAADPAGLAAVYGTDFGYVRDCLLLLDRQAHYSPGVSPLALLWKDAQTSQYFVESRSADVGEQITTLTARARAGRLSALSVSRTKSVLYGTFAWARRTLNGPTRRVPARAADRGRRARHLRRPAGGADHAAGGGGRRGRAAARGGQRRPVRDNRAPGGPGGRLRRRRDGGPARRGEYGARGRRQVTPAPYSPAPTARPACASRQTAMRRAAAGSAVIAPLLTERGAGSISKIIFQYSAIRGQALPFAALLEAAALPAPAVAADGPGAPRALRSEFSVPLRLKRLALFTQAPYNTPPEEIGTLHTSSLHTVPISTRAVRRDILPR
jgi:hypothetical protein